jgi:hypothetical protein
VGFVGGETGYCNETFVTYDVGTEEFRIKSEVDLDIKDEMQEVVIVPSVKTEHEVRLECVCVRW